jgi:heme exporter protein D
MSFSSWAEFMAMGGYGLYVWGSLGMCVAVALAEMGQLKLRRQALTIEAGHDIEHDTLHDAGGAA